MFEERKDARVRLISGTALPKYEWHHLLPGDVVQLQPPAPVRGPWLVISRVRIRQENSPTSYTEWTRLTVLGPDCQVCTFDI